MADVSVAIVNWNGREILRDCLSSLLPQTERAVETWVVDNASSDGSVEMVERDFPTVRVIRNDRNVGFARATNQAIDRSSGRYVLLLNNDTVLRPGALDRLIDCAEAHPGDGAFGPRLVGRDGQLQLSCRHFPGVGREVVRTLASAGLVPRRSIGRWSLDHWPHDRLRRVDWLIGACLLVRRETIEQVGRLDERFYFYGEDLEWCYRIGRAGWGILFCPDAEVVHIGGESAALRWGEDRFVLSHYGAVLQFLGRHGTPMQRATYRATRSLALGARLLGLSLSLASTRDPRALLDRRESFRVNARCLALCLGATGAAD